MSTTVYLECLEHKPPISSEEVGQHLYDLDDIREYIEMRDVLVKIAEKDWGIGCHQNPNWVGAAMFFFECHVGCQIQIKDEYGVVHPNVADEMCNKEQCRCRDRE